MPQGKDKYSLWIVPRGKAAEKIQALTDKLADENHARHFVPHITLIANVFTDSTETENISVQIRQCAERISPFAVRLTSYGHMDEEFRCLYLTAESPELQQVYKNLTEQFPQVAEEHFQAMPHMSVLYGNYSEETKQQIIKTNPVPVTEFAVDSFDLYITNDPVKTWRLIHSFKLGHS